MATIEALGPVWEALGLMPAAIALAFFRISGLMLFLPAFGERMVPARVRLAAAFALTVAVAPMIDPAVVPAEVTWTLIVVEIGIGSALGAILRFMTQALQIAGAVAAQSTSLAQIFGAAQMDASSAIGNVLHLAGLALLTTTGLHLLVIDLLARSWDVFPPGLVLPGPDVAEWGLARVGAAFALALALAAPFVLAAVLYNLALGVINKAMPQLMVALVGAPAITGVSLILTASTAVLILTVWREHVLGVFADPVLPWP
jgi:flagellar biosynthetic protein FliR